MEAGLYEKALPLAQKVMEYARDTILVNLRFLAPAISALTLKERQGLGGFACDGSIIYYDPVYLLKKYKEEQGYAIRCYLHILFHLIFWHSFRYDRVEKEYWNLSSDIAVENVILELEVAGGGLRRDGLAAAKLALLREEAGGLTAERLYRYLKNNEIRGQSFAELKALFFMDEHIYWTPREEISLTQEQWKKMSQRVRAELQSFSKGRSTSESLQKNLAEAVKDRYDYGELLKRFTMMSEDMQVNDDEFDYIYYTYGLQKYGNMPLVEPLEYKDSRKVREFVIALDTSASCRGPIVQAFLRKSYGILKGEENFFRKMNVHIIQCDSQVQKDTRITSQEDFDYFLAHETLQGFGSTDFRPVFSHVEKLISRGEFENLKGLIYFTDGYGVYPEKMPPYEVMFVFLDRGDNPPEVPPWAVRVLLEDEELEE